MELGSSSAASEGAMITRARRMNEVMRAWWEEARAERAYPYEADVEPEALAAVWDSCFLVEHRPDAAPAFDYVYLGEELVRAFADEQQGNAVCRRLIFPLNDLLEASFHQIVRDQVPLEHADSFRSAGGPEIRFRSVMLPLGEAQRRSISHIIGGLRWRAYL